MFLVIIICIVFVAIALFILINSNNTAWDGTLYSTSIVYLNGCLGYQSGVEVKIEANTEKITIDKKYSIIIQNISDMRIIKTKQLTEQQKNIIGRAIIGTLLAGGIGGIIGGISGAGTTKKTEEVDILYVTYKDGNNIEQTMSFAIINLAEKSWLLTGWANGLIGRINGRKVLITN